MSKTLTVYKPKEKTFDWELYGLDVYALFAGGNFKFTDNFDNADIIPHNGIGKVNLPATHNFLKRKNLKNKIFLNLHLFLHAQENQNHIYIKELFKSDEELFNRLPAENIPKYFILHCNLNFKTENPKFIFSDFLWNRQIAFFVDQPDSIFKADPRETRGHWYPRQLRKEIYDLYDIDQYCNVQYLERIYHNSTNGFLKSYYSANNVLNAHYINSEYSGFEEQKKYVPHWESQEHKHVRHYFRNELNKLLELYPGHLGKAKTNNFLLGQDMTTREYEGIIEGTYRNHGWWPVNNVYCRSTPVNIYVETLTYNHTEVRQITEKTWDPLIKGNFILPFGYCGLIKDLKEIYNFKFPEWIDYSYDKIHIDSLRWFAYLDSVKKLLSNNTKMLFLQKIKDKEILKHNRNLFFEKRYRNPIPNIF